MIVCKISVVTTAAIVVPDHSSKNRTHALIVYIEEHNTILKNTIRDKSSVYPEPALKIDDPFMTVHDRSRVKTGHDVGHDVAHCVQPYVPSPNIQFFGGILGFSHFEYVSNSFLLWRASCVKARVCANAHD